MDEATTSFVIMTNLYKAILVTFLLYFVIRYKDWLLLAILILGTTSIILEINGHHDAAILMSNPTATLLAFKMARAARYNYQVKTKKPGDII